MDSFILDTPLSRWIKELAGKTQVHLEILRRFATEGIRLADPIEGHISLTDLRGESVGRTSSDRVATGGSIR
jgi:hypothetical protein